MTPSVGIPDILERFKGNTLTYDELVSLYQSLQTGSSANPEVTVSRRAVAYVIGDMIDYLDFVSGELEKSIGITRQEELTRILNTLEEPKGSNPIEQVDDLIQQWESVDLYTFDEILATVGK